LRGTNSEVDAAAVDARADFCSRSGFCIWLKYGDEVFPLCLLQLFAVPET
jgi:hypothetical protein